MLLLTKKISFFGKFVINPHPSDVTVLVCLRFTFTSQFIAKFAHRKLLFNVSL